MTDLKKKKKKEKGQSHSSDNLDIELSAQKILSELC